jgi:hypothetical protein
MLNKQLVSVDLKLFESFIKRSPWSIESNEKSRNVKTEPQLYLGHRQPCGRCSMISLEPGLKGIKKFI